MPNITKEEVLRIADLARMTLTEAEVDMHLKYLQSITAYADKLNELDTEGVEATIHGVDFKNIMRKDEPVNWTTREEILNNAPDHKEGHFRVPTILE